MNFIRRNKVFSCLAASLIVINVVLAYWLLVPSETSASSSLSSTENDTSDASTAINTFSGSFNDYSHAVELAWDVTCEEDVELTSLSVAFDEQVIEELEDATSLSLNIEEYDLATGNNDFHLTAVFDDGTELSKTVYVYIDEVYDFSVSTKTEIDRLTIILHYYYDDRNEPSFPSLSYSVNTKNYFSVEAGTSEILSQEGHTVEMEVDYDLLYNDAEVGSYTAYMTFTIQNYNLSFSQTLTFDVYEVTVDESEDVEDEVEEDTSEEEDLSEEETDTESTEEESDGDASEDSTVD